MQTLTADLAVSRKSSTFAPDFKHDRVMSNKTKLIIKIIITVLIAAASAVGASLGLTSCNAVRTITNRSEFYQKGDTSVMIQTKTTESYDATQKIAPRLY